MIVDEIMNIFSPKNISEPPPAPIKPETRPEYVRNWGQTTVAGQRVTVEKSKSIATAYRCGNILSDDIASLPFQVFTKQARTIVRIEPDPVTRNTAYLAEIEPNRWMTPFVFKKTVILWLIYYGNAYIWEPAEAYREWFILDADKTTPGFDQNGNKVYQTFFPNGEAQVLPDNEVIHLMINSTDGLSGKSVLTYARETMGRQLAAHETQNQVQSNGLSLSAALYFDGTADQEARAKIKKSYLDAVKGDHVAIFDKKVTKFEKISMTPADAQFIEGINATDAELANFFGMPLHKLNMGKQSYESNEAQQLDYMKTTLNPYLVQWEQCARLKWFSESERGKTYMRFIREALMSTDAATRGKYLKDLILSGQLTPNEALQINDMSAYDGGDAHYIPSNMARVLKDGSLEYGNKDSEKIDEGSNENE